MASISSKTGLLPIQKTFPSWKKRQKTKTESLPSAAISKRVEFSIRPLGGLYNPYSKGCSVLCNHPAPSAVRNIIKKVKDSLSIDVKFQNDGFEIDPTSKIPEELIRRYTDTDSRPLTPSLTGSIRTKISGTSILNTRRCVTPEPGKDMLAKRKKIILDLRRSHSQETLHWKAPSEISQSLTIDTADTPKESSPKTKQEKRTSAKAMKVDETKSEPIAISEERSEDKEIEDLKLMTCINERDPEDVNYLQRRGKRRKKSKALLVSSTTFQLNRDPETQVSALGPDSVNVSTRPSLAQDQTVLLEKSAARKESQSTPLKGSFLTEEAFNVLKVGLNIDVIENTFDRYLNRARREAMKFLVPKDNQLYGDGIASSVTGLYFEQDKKLPRKLSKSSSRFEMPIYLKSLENMTVFEYLSQHVWVSSQRKQLYKRTFLKYLISEQISDVAENEFPMERLMPASSVSKALEEALGFYGTQTVIDKLMSLVFGNTDVETLNFRSWCGIVAFAERLALTDPSEFDSCDELEKADFETMEERIDTMKVPQDLYDVLFIIRKGHCCKT